MVVCKGGFAACLALAKFFLLAYSEQGADPPKFRAAQKPDRAAALLRKPARKEAHLAAPRKERNNPKGSSKKGLTLALFRKPFFGIF